MFFDHINGMHDGKDREYFICNQCGKHFRLRNQLKYVCYHLSHFPETNNQKNPMYSDLNYFIFQIAR